ncbi:MAG: hypothetical protein U9Q15_00085 [Patescibacteria group bacterium]|nr:hypothetical protein [Patescibacteria group bacterium]
MIALYDITRNQISRFIITALIFAVVFAILYGFLYLFSPNAGTLHLTPEQEDVGYQVWIDDKYQGAFQGEQNITVAVGEYTVSIFSDNYAKYQPVLTFEKRETTEYSWRFEIQEDLYSLQQYHTYELIDYQKQPILDNQYQVYCAELQCNHETNTRKILSQNVAMIKPSSIQFASGSDIVTFLDQGTFYRYHIDNDRFYEVISGVTSYQRYGPDHVVYLRVDDQ